MKFLLKCSLVCVTLAVSLQQAAAEELEFHGYARVGFGISTRGGNQGCYSLGSGDAKLRLGNECDWVLEPSFSKSFVKMENNSQWGVSMMPSFYARMDDDGFIIQDPDTKRTTSNLRAKRDIPIGFNEFFFYGRGVPAFNGGEIWLGRRYFDRQYLGAINDQFLEAQDGVGAGIQDIGLVGPSKISFSIIYNPFTDAQPEQVNDRTVAGGVHVYQVQTFNQDSNLQLWGHIYVPSAVAGTPRRKVGYSGSITHQFGFGAGGNLGLSFRYDRNAYTDQQNSGAGGAENIRVVAVHGVRFASARTNLDLVAEFRRRNNVATLDSQNDVRGSNNWIQAGFRTDTQIVGGFRFLLEAGVDTSQNSDQDDNTRHTLFKITPCIAYSAGNDAGSRPTFRLFYTQGIWNKDATNDVLTSWKDSALPSQYVGKTSGGSIGLQAEAGW